MNCYICDGPLGDPKLDPRDHKIKHCNTCEEVILECLSEFEADDDEYDDDYEDEYEDDEEYELDEE